MNLNPFLKFGQKSCLGIDIGSSSIKITELFYQSGKIELKNYGEVSLFTFQEKPFRNFEKTFPIFSNQEVSQVIKAILLEAKMSTQKAVISIPDFSTFFTYFELPAMSKEELESAVVFEARHHIPFPLNEVTLDWLSIKNDVSSEQNNKKQDNEKVEKIKILLVAVPNEIINEYQEIARLAGIKVFAVEAEVFSLTRALTNQNDKVLILIDIGAQSTTISVVDHKSLKRSYSFDISGNEFTKTLASSLEITYREAENIKRARGLLEKETSQILYPLIDVILKEIREISQNFSQETGKEIEQIVLAGGSACLPGLKDYIFQKFGKETIIINPFSKISFPSNFEEILKKMSPNYAVAVGAALRGLQ